MLADIFWGPDVCEAQIRKQERTSRWLDDVFGEAAVALCKDTRTVAFYDGRCPDDVRDTAARMMRAIWGWTVKPERFVTGVAATLGVDLWPLANPTPFDTSLAKLDHLAHKADFTRSVYLRDFRRLSCQGASCELNSHDSSVSPIVTPAPLLLGPRATALRTGSPVSFDHVAALPVPELVHSVGRFERAMWLARFEPQRPPTVIEFAAPPDLVLGAALQGQPLPAPSAQGIVIELASASPQWVAALARELTRPAT